MTGQFRAAREVALERTPAERKIEHTNEYVDLVGFCHSYVATLGRLGPRPRDQGFTGDERVTVRRGIARVRAAVDWLEEGLRTPSATQRTAPELVTHHADDPAPDPQRPPSAMAGVAGGDRTDERLAGQLRRRLGAPDPRAHPRSAPPVGATGVAVAYGPSAPRDASWSG
ncbi:DUF6192 family protein [Streptomyces sp. Ncost-T10-10d]|uniref:DUF6192 family protein n=1 Tax=Streptomyces sp. Ncost-T10-10d TaxID=1839774 RepID=UPI000B16CEB6|nr:DUF6192 family protein [Streptomyces sp. Ncost-T10-10d]